MVSLRPAIHGPEGCTQAMRKYRKTAVLSLVLVAGGAALVSCDSAQAEQRAVYQNKEDCLKDWVGSAEADLKSAEEVCTPATSGAYPRGYFFGPAYMFLAGVPRFFSPSAGTWVNAPRTSGVYVNRGFTNSRAYGTATFSGGAFRSASVGRPSIAPVSRGGFGSFGRGVSVGG